jgi:hypothetical protein
MEPERIVPHCLKSQPFFLIWCAFFGLKRISTVKNKQKIGNWSSTNSRYVSLYWSGYCNCIVSNIFMLIRVPWCCSICWCCYEWKVLSLSLWSNSNRINDIFGRAKRWFTPNSEITNSIIGRFLSCFTLHFIHLILRRTCQYWELVKWSWTMTQKI